jgi:hypothetical protein
MDVAGIDPQAWTWQNLDKRLVQLVMVVQLVFIIGVGLYKSNDLYKVPGDSGGCRSALARDGVLEIAPAGKPCCYGLGVSF